MEERGVQPLDDGQITHLVCPRLKMWLYASAVFFWGVGGPRFSCFFPSFVPFPVVTHLFGYSLRNLQRESPNVDALRATRRGSLL